MASENDSPDTNDTHDTSEPTGEPQPVSAPAAPARARRTPAKKAAVKKAAAPRKTAVRKTAGRRATAATDSPESPEVSPEVSPDSPDAPPLELSDTPELTEPAPVRPVRKRASRKATAPTQAPDLPVETDTPAPTVAETIEAEAEAEAEVEVETDAAPVDAPDVDGGSSQSEADPAPGSGLAEGLRSAFGLLFQPPSPTRRSRRSSSPAQPPAEVPLELPVDLAAVDPSTTDGDTEPTDAEPTDVEPTDVEPAVTEPTDGLELGGDVDSEHPSADDTADDSTDDSADDSTDEVSDAGQQPRRRRRRGGKGRRGRGASADGASDATSSSAPADYHGTLDASDGSDADDHGQRPEVAGQDGDQSGRAPSRTRGRRGGSATSTGGADAGTAGGNDDAGADDSADAGSAGGGSSESGTSRRRTRRRRRSGAGGDAADSPGVTTRVREPRSDRDEVTGVKGSTRLEAKKQRRREGREAGRRRTIITEAEFLARRESVDRVMVVRHKGGRTQIGVLEDEVLVEHYISRETNVSMAGNIYLGRVQNVLPSMEAAFVDIGKGRNAVLYAGEVNWDAAGLGQGQPKRIEHALSSGQNVLVQVTKDPIGHKGARLTSQISLPGRYLVYVPDSSMTGISRKLPDTERARLKRILKEVVPDSAGVIVRTAAEGASEDELRADVDRLTATWDDISSKVAAVSGGATPSGRAKKGKAKSGGGASGTAPQLLHGEPDLTVRVIRDIFNEDFSSLVVAGQEAWDEVSGYVDTVAPDLASRVTRWTSEEDLFTHYRVDEQIAKAMDRKVWLPSGGSLVIDRTEAMTVVDVNTGKFIGSGGNLEETVTKNNIEAAEEIVRQLRLRDIGGIIVVDFIDMVLESNRDLVVRRLLECLGRDRTKHQVAEVTSLGLVQMTRKRVGSGLIEVFGETCEHCGGRGFVIHADPVDRSSGAHGSSGQDGYGPSHDSASNGGRAARTRRGRPSDPHSFDAAATTPAPPAVVRGGPTPAQIAAAAHAAALKVVTEVAEVAEVSEVSEVPEVAEVSDEPGTTDTTPDVGADVPADPDVRATFEQAVVEALESEAQPAPRRRRGRVSAPAGPPRAEADSGQATG